MEIEVFVAQINVIIFAIRCVWLVDFLKQRKFIEMAIHPNDFGLGVTLFLDVTVE